MERQNTMEEYFVKFAVQENGFVVRKSEIVRAEGKKAHQKVSEVITNKYPKCNIISVTYC